MRGECSLAAEEAEGGLTTTGRLWDSCGRGMPRPYDVKETR